MVLIIFDNVDINKLYNKKQNISGIKSNTLNYIVLGSTTIVEAQHLLHV